MYRNVVPVVPVVPRVESFPGKYQPTTLRLVGVGDYTENASLSWLTDFGLDGEAKVSRQRFA